VQSQDNPDYIALIETVRLARQTNADYAD